MTIQDPYEVTRAMECNEIDPKVQVTKKTNQMVSRWFQTNQFSRATKCGSLCELETF